MTKLEVLFSPAEFAALKPHDLSNSICVVFDVLRATTSMITALGNGAKAIIPVSEISEAVVIWKAQPDVLLGGERDGVKIRAAQTGGVDFDLGNSPREYLEEKVRGKIIVSTTTNGTRALRACASAKTVLAGSFANLRVTADFIAKLRAETLLLICAGTFEEAAYEDTLCAGALCDLIWSNFPSNAIADSAQMARQIFLSAGDNTFGAVEKFSKNGRRLLTMPELREDVEFCLRRDTTRIVAQMQSNGSIKPV